MKWVALLLLGCSGETEKTRLGPDIPEVNVAGTIIQSLDGTPHSDVKVCTSDSESCDSTDTVGLYSIVTKANAFDHLLAEAMDFRSAVIPFFQRMVPLPSHRSPCLPKPRYMPFTMPPFSLNPPTLESSLFRSTMASQVMT